MMATRPLSAGEVLDRAVTLFVRAFIPIVTVAAVVYTPVFILEGVVAGGSLDTIMQSVTKPECSRTCRRAFSPRTSLPCCS